MSVGVKGGMTAGAAPGVKVPPHQRFALDNGVRVLLLPRHDVPLVACDAVIKGGARLDAPGLAGTANVVAELTMRGAGGRNAQEFAEAVEGAGGSLDAEARFEAVLVHGQFLSRDQPLMLELLADALLRPRFAPAEFEPLCRRRIELLRATRDSDPQALLGDYGRALLFAGHPFGSPLGGDEHSLAALQREDVLGFYRDHFGADRLTLVFAGDFETEAMRMAVTRAFSSWHRAPAALPALVPAPRVRGRRVLLVDAPGSAQSYFWIGNVGVARADDARAALDIANTAFGGSFNSMLMQALRARSGLTYSVHSGFRRGSIPGEFSIGSFTDKARTGRALEIALRTLGRLHAAKLSDAAIHSARSYLLGQYPLAFETAADWGVTLADLDLYGLDDGYINDYGAALLAASREEVARVIAVDFPQPEDVDIVLIADAARVRRALTQFGPVLEKPLAAGDFAPPA